MRPARADESVGMRPRNHPPGPRGGGRARDVSDGMGRLVGVLRRGQSRSAQHHRDAQAKGAQRRARICRIFWRGPPSKARDGSKPGRSSCCAACSANTTSSMHRAPCTRRARDHRGRSKIPMSPKRNGVRRRPPRTRNGWATKPRLPRLSKMKTVSRESPRRTSSPPSSRKTQLPVTNRA